MIEEMDNQVATLREMARQAERNRHQVERDHQDGPRLQPGEAGRSLSRRRVPYTLAITSGKGGVGKSVITVHLALQFASMGLKVLIIDADLGLANIDVMLDLHPKFTIQDVVDGRMTLDEVAVVGPMGITVLPAASGVAELSHLSDAQRIALLDHIDHWNADFDVVLVDTGAGISTNVRYFVLAVEKIVVVATPDPSSIADAYALVKVMFLNHRIANFDLIVNQVDAMAAEQDGKDVYRTIHQTAERFLNIGLNYLGAIPHDPQLARMVRQNRIIMDDTLPYMQVFKRMANNILQVRQTGQADGSRPTFFWRQVLDESAE
ncbi:MAG: MinD/ParA family protein [Magnetococcales bacterium]|nr:MinD/ParA family protein [Magnetococcales bacterium]